MKNENYIVIQGWMVNELRLKGNHLLIFALLYGFSQDGETEFKGSNKYICKALNTSKPTVIKSLSYLLKLGLILKRIEVVNNVQFNRFSINLQVVKNCFIRGKETLRGGKDLIEKGGKETLPNNTINNKTNNTINIKNPISINLFGEEILDPKKKTLFKNCIYSDFGKFELKMNDAMELGIDIGHYHRAMDRWSRTSTTKRTADGWIATAETWMENDKNNGK